MLDPIFFWLFLSPGSLVPIPAQILYPSHRLPSHRRVASCDPQIPCYLYLAAASSPLGTSKHTLGWISL